MQNNAARVVLSGNRHFAPNHSLVNRTGCQFIDASYTRRQAVLMRKVHVIRLCLTLVINKVTAYILVIYLLSLFEQHIRLHWLVRDYNDWVTPVFLITVSLCDSESSCVRQLKTSLFDRCFITLLLCLWRCILIWVLVLLISNSAITNGLAWPLETYKETHSYLSKNLLR